MLLAFLKLIKKKSI